LLYPLCVEYRRLLLCCRFAARQMNKQFFMTLVPRSQALQALDRIPMLMDYRECANISYTLCAKIREWNCCVNFDTKLVQISQYLSYLRLII
jgi:hypothetical protein